MNTLNSLILEGNITDKVETSNIFGATKGEFTLETKRTYNFNGEKVEETNNFIIYCYGETANLMQLHSNKGQGARVVGRLKQERYKDTDGKMHAKVVVIAEHIELKPLAKKD